MDKKKPMRTLSGITPIAVMVRVKNSCKWNCAYCPTSNRAPKSYVGYEPAALRAIVNDFDPFKQTQARIRQFQRNKHSTKKCEIIIMGGTFLSMPNKYKTNFVKRIYDCLNKKSSRTLDSAKRLNERAEHRMCGLVIETRPDVCGKKEVNELLNYGATRVELGVQNPLNSIYKKINRGHCVKDVVNATELLKNTAFKVGYHLMIGLPGASPKKDINMFKKIFSDSKFRPDVLKIYPTVVVPNTALYKLMFEKEYEPYTTKTAAEVIANAYRYIPKYVRIMRIQRDIPANLIVQGVKKSNLRQIAEKRARELGIKINEIRYNEIGLRYGKITEPKLVRFDYTASKGREVFLYIENKSTKEIIGFLRLRIVDGNAALIRELHIYGEETELGVVGSVQHRGFGKWLLSEAEKISKEEFDKKIIKVISGVGVRQYYYKRGYALDRKKQYVIKNI